MMKRLKNNMVNKQYKDWKVLGSSQGDLETTLWQLENSDWVIFQILPDAIPSYFTIICHREKIKPLMEA